MAMEGARVRLSQTMPASTRAKLSDPLNAMAPTWPLVNSGPITNRHRAPISPLAHEKKRQCTIESGLMRATMSSGLRPMLS